MHDFSAEGLHCMTKHYFEIFGWMLLAHRDGHNKQINCYSDNIELLIKRVDEKIKYLKNLNKKANDVNIINKINEFKIMKENLVILHKDASNLYKIK